MMLPFSFFIVIHNLSLIIQIVIMSKSNCYIYWFFSFNTHFKEWKYLSFFCAKIRMKFKIFQYVISFKVSLKFPKSFCKTNFCSLKFQFVFFYCAVKIRMRYIQEICYISVKYMFYVFYKNYTFLWNIEGKESSNFSHLTETKFILIIHNLLYVH